jgi:hypothetical protein
MKSKPATDILKSYGYRAAVQEWIVDRVPCVLLKKDDYIDIYPLSDYEVMECTMAEKHPGYQPEWVPLGQGTYREMEMLMHNVLEEDYARERAGLK